MSHDADSDDDEFKDTPPELVAPDGTGPRYAPLSWDAVKAVRAGLIPGPYPEDFNGPGYEAAEPTKARPGTPEKIEVLAARYARREQLFHKRDTR